jgi:triacylglycerol lipase
MFPSVYPCPFNYRNPADLSIAPGAPDAMPLDIAAVPYRIGPRIKTQQTSDLYAPLHADASFEGITIARDLPYGPHERHVLDVFSRSGGAADRPVVVFVHGGEFSRGQKSAPESPYYDNVMRWAADNGLVGVSINYRLAPEFQWPSGVADLGRVLAWIDSNISANRVGMGESPGPAGAILTSGFYELGSEVSAWSGYYGDDVTQYPAHSALDRLVTAELPMFVNDAELDPADFGHESAVLVAGRRAAALPVEYVHLLGHSHISELYAVGTSDQSLSKPVLEFIRREAR